MKSIKIFAIALAGPFAMGLFACSDKTTTPPPVVIEEVTLSTDNLEFTWEAGEQTVEVTGTDWVASTDATWVTVSPEAGKDGAITVTVTVTQNDTAADRSATLTVENTTGAKTLRIQQGGVPGEILVYPKTLEFIFMRETKTVNVTSETAWTVVSDQTSWLTVQKTAENRFEATALTNDGDEPRTATITIDNGGTTKTIPVTQEENRGQLFVEAEGQFLGESWGPGTGDFEISLLTFTTTETGVSNAGIALSLNPITETPAYDEWCTSMTNGVYTMSESCQAMTLYPGYQYVVPVDENGKSGKYIDVADGTLTVEGTYADYTLTVDFVLKDGSTLKGIYRGPLLIRNPKKLSDFTENLDLTLTAGNLNFVTVYEDFIDIWRPQFYSEGLTVRNGYLEGDGYVFMAEIYTETTGGKSFPDGEYTIVPRGTKTAPWTVYTGFEYAGTRYATWMLELKDGKIDKAAPIISGTVTTSNGGATIAVDAKDDVGNAIKATYTGSSVPLSIAPAAAPAIGQRVAAGAQGSVVNLIPKTVR